tara:strand:+ start:426 stop:998 length:573 start_codon:yes stop_codon:yes gene_type:complete
MKKILLPIFIFLNLINFSYGNDANQVQIGGIFFGDSLLNYTDEAFIKSQQVDYYTNNKYSTSRFSSPSDEFVHIEISYRTDDKDYKIIELSGFSYLADSCENQIKAVSTLYADELFDKKKKEGKRKHPYDKTGESIITGITYYFKGGVLAEFQCIDMSKKIEEEGYPDHFIFGIYERKFIEWKRKNVKNL